MPVYVESSAAYSGSNAALIGYQDQVRDATLTASSEQTNHPVENLADGFTFDFWKPSSTGSQTVVVDAGEAVTVDYVAIAAHNLSSESAGDVVVAYSDDDSAYTTAYTLSNSSITDDSPILIHLASRSHRYWRLTVNADSTDLAIGVLFVGELLQMQRNIYEGNTPAGLKRTDSTIPNLSDEGNFIGRYVTRSFYEASHQWEHLTPSWYRTNFKPFVTTSREWPFFLAWRPDDYPDEIVYAWRTRDISPGNDGPTGYMSVRLDLQAVTE